VSSVATNTFTVIIPVHLKSFVVAHAAHPLAISQSQSIESTTTADEISVDLLEDIFDDLSDFEEEADEEEEDEEE